MTPMIWEICCEEFLDPAHRRHGPRDDLAGFSGVGLHRGDDFGGLAGAARRLLHAGRQLLDRRRRLFEARRLSLGAPRKILRSLGDLLRPQSDPGDGMGHSGHRALQSGHGFVEVGLEPAELGREIVIDAGAKVAGREELQRRRGRLHGEGGLLLRLKARQFRPPPLFVEGFEIARYAVIHIEHDRLDDDGDGFGRVFGVIFRAPQQARPMVRHQRADKALRHQRIGADVPARLEPEARMHLADRLYGLNIGLAIFGRADDRPVLLLPALGGAHMRLVAEKGAELRRFRTFS